MIRGVDTNVLVYALDNRAGWKHERAVEIVERILKNPEGYLVAGQVLAETLYVVKRKNPSATPLAQLLILSLSKRIPIVSYTHAEVLQASASPKRYYWDRLLAYTYLNNGAEVIVTEDERPYKGILKVENPFKEPTI